MKIMVHDINSCLKCKPLVELLEKDTVTAQELEGLKANKGVNFDGDDKGREIDENGNTYILPPWMTCPHFYPPTTITFKQNSEGMYTKV